MKVPREYTHLFEPDIVYVISNKKCTMKMQYFQEKFGCTACKL